MRSSVIFNIFGLCCKCPDTTTPWAQHGPKQHSAAQLTRLHLGPFCLTAGSELTMGLTCLPLLAHTDFGHFGPMLDLRLNLAGWLILLPFHTRGLTKGRATDSKWPCQAENKFDSKYVQLISVHTTNASASSATCFFLISSEICAAAAALSDSPAPGPAIEITFSAHVAAFDALAMGLCL